MMKLKLFLCTFMLLGLIGIAPIFAGAQEKNSDYDWMKQRLAATKAFTIDVLKAMPEDKYDFRPGEGIRTFKEQAYHIVYSIDYYKRVFSGNPQAVWQPGKEDAKSRAELLKWADEEFDAIEKTIMAAKNNPRLTAGIISFLDHNAHHRGQMIIYLRKNGIKAPNYR
jgi:uncharacterized damage-inducible protein DinB